MPLHASPVGLGVDQDQANLEALLPHGLLRLC